MKFKNDIEAQSDIILDGALTDAGGSPGAVNQLLSSTVTGTAWIDPSTIVAEAATLVVIACKNTSGAAIAQGTPVYQTGTVGATATIEIAPADALISANKLPAIGLLQTALSNNGFGNVVITGELTNFTTSPIDGVVPTTGDKIFVKSGGGLTLTKPTGEGNGIQNMGLVGKVSSGNSGSITVSSIMRTNDVPNLPEGRIWVGDGNTIVSDTVYVDEPNNRVGIGTDSPNKKLTIQTSDSSWGSIRIYRDSATLGETGIGFFGTSTQATNQAWVIGEGGWGNTGDFVIGNENGGAGGNVRLLVQRNGNVGIGTTSPSEKLDVVGNIELNGALYIGSRGIYQQENTDVDTGTETVANVAIATYTAAFFDFVVKKTTNVRSGTVYACHDGTNVEFTETSTNDLGDTSDVTLSVDISGTNMRLLATVTSDDWSVKSLIRAI